MKAISFSRFLTVIAILVLAGMIFSCQEKPFDHPFGNREPDTFITGVSLTPVAIGSTEYSYSVTFTGLDSDGQLIAFEYKVGNMTVWQEVAATTTNLTGTLDFPTAGTEHSVEVRAMDQNRVVDSTPATYNLTTALFQNTNPSIAFTNAPPQDAVISGGIVIGVGGSDFGGKLERFDYKVDAGVWMTVYPNSIGQADISLSYMSEGYHTLFVKAVDNLGGESETMTRSFYSKLNFFTATVTEAIPAAGAVILTGEPLIINVNGDAGYYYCDVTGYQFSKDNGANWTPVIGDNFIDFSDINDYTDAEGKAYFKYRIYDNGGGIVEGAMEYVPVNLTEFRAGKKVLFVNGIDHSTYGDGMIADHTMFGNRNFLYWEGITINPAAGPGYGIIPVGYGAIEFPTYIHDSCFYTGNTNAEIRVIAHAANNYNGDYGSYTENIEFYKTFMTNGGQIYHAGRQYADWFTGTAAAMGEFLEITDIEYTGLITTRELTPLVAGLPALALPSSNSRNQSIIGTPASSNVTMIYAHDAGANFGGFHFSIGGEVRFVSLSCRPYRPGEDLLPVTNWIFENWFNLPPDY